MGQDRGRGPLSRRRFIGGLVGGGGITLLVGCGGVATPTTAIAPTVVARTPAATVATTPVVSGGGTATRTLTVGATRTPAIGTPGASALARALALVPQRAPLPGTEGLAFADLLTQKRNYGLGEATSAAAFQALQDAPAVLANLTNGLPLPTESGVEHALDPEWREAVGYDFWQIERTISAGSPPNVWSRLEGRFAQPEIVAALGRAGHQPVTYDGATILARGDDRQIVDLNQPITRLTLARLNRVVLEEGALTATAATALAEAGIDARAGRLDTFAADPDHAALVAALGPVVGARLITAELFFRPQSANPRATPSAASPVRSAAPGRPKLNPYRLVGLGLRDDGTTHTMLVALVYADAAAARADAPILRQRATDYQLLATRQPLRERAVVGEPTVVVDGDRATLVLPFAIADTANLGLWQRMFFQRDYGFLAE
ncbi:MAG TPA: hypothetical protein VIL85_07930 [Thermomicrobiales bacterium]|jgi:hypothetical protein